MYYVRFSALNILHASRTKKKSKSARANCRRDNHNLNLGQQVLDSLNRLRLDVLAKRTGFCERKSGKITPSRFVQSCLALALQKCVSLTVWAALLGILAKDTVSKQALAARLGQGAALFLKEVLAGVLALSIGAKRALSPLARHFKRILVQDSTCVKLTEKLAPVYPGGSNQHGLTPGVLRIQAVFDLLSQSWVRFDLSSYRRCDQKASADMLSIVKKGDLVIRDLGYFVLDVLEGIRARGASFVSRFHPPTKIYDSPDQARPLDLLKLLRKVGSLDRLVWLAAQRMSVRMVAIHLPQAVADERRRKARARQNKSGQPLSKTYMALLDWTIYITDVDKETLPPEQIAALYGQRWHIEIIFKAWKSHFHFESAISPNISQNEIDALIYGKLLLITMACPLPGRRAGGPQGGASGQFISMLKVSMLVSLSFFTVLLDTLGISLSRELARQIRYHCRYEKRRRVPLIQKLFTLA